MKDPSIASSNIETIEREIQRLQCSLIITYALGFSFWIESIYLNKSYFLCLLLFSGVVLTADSRKLMDSTKKVVCTKVRLAYNKQTLVGVIASSSVERGRLKSEDVSIFSAYNICSCVRAPTSERVRKYGVFGLWGKHYGCFWGFIVQKVLMTNLNFRYSRASLKNTAD